MRILLTGGGTGGHSFPLIAVSQALRNLAGDKIELFYLGANGFTRRIFQEQNIKARFIFSAKLRRYFSLKTVLDFIKLPLSILQALFWLFVLMPDVVFSKGGPGSPQVILAAWFYHIPIIIHESDTMAGLSNRFAGRFAKKVALAFEKAQDSFAAEKVIIVGNPVRQQLLQTNQQKAQEAFQLNQQQPVLLVVGGSQGAQFINELVLSILPELLQKYQVIHISGPANYQRLSASLRGTKQSLNLTNYHLYAFLNEQQMALAYTASHLVLARSGAGAIFELAALAKPSILIPLPDAAGDHQRINAYEYAKTGAALVLEQSNLREHILLQRISAILDDPTSQAQMSQAARQFAKPEAAKIIAQQILILVNN